MMGFPSFQHIIVTLLSLVVFGEIVEGKMSVSINAWRNCIGSEQLNILITEFSKNTSTQSRRVFVVNGTIPDMAVATQDVSFCSLPDHPDACDQENAKDFLWTCPMMLKKGKPWSEFINSIQPKFECPLKPGNYNSSGPDSDIWKIFSSDLKKVKSGVYQVIISINADYEPFLCWQMEFEIKK